MLMADYKKILLVRNDNIGDLICTTPAIEALRKKYPKDKIDIVVNSYNFDAIYNNPFVNKIYCYTKSKHKHSFIDKVKVSLEKLKILFQIKKENYDIVIIFRGGYSKSAALFSKITNAKIKIGVADEKGKDDFTHHIIPLPNMHEVELCFACLQPLNVNYANEQTKYFLKEDFQKKYKEFQDFTLFHISSRMKNNKLSFQKLSQIFSQVQNKKIIITAEPGDFEMAEKLEKQYTNIQFIKTSSFNDLGGVIFHAKTFVTLEGGAMHLGAALGKTTIALFGQSNKHKWAPWGYKNLILQDSSKIAENIENSQIIKMFNEN
jgi:heptosyltransferase III